MNQQTLFTAIITLFLTDSSLSLECVLIGHNCTFSGIRTTEASPHFHPHASDNDTVHIVEFTDSVMPVLTNELCKVFPNLKELWADKLSLERIQGDALLDCKKLKYISFWTNKLQGVVEHILVGNQELETVSFQGNYLMAVDGRMFTHNKKLRRLCLADNFLNTLALDNFPILEELEELFVHVNDLTDLDDRELIRKFRNLKDIYIHNNMFNCDLVPRIIDGLRRNNVKVKEWYKHAYTRNANLKKIDNVECVQSELI